MVGLRSSLFSRKQPGGMFTIVNIDDHPADVWFVDSGSGTDGAGYGQDPDSPVATIDYAVGLCTASQGDIIYVLPGHAETINAAAAIDFDVIGIRIIGIGDGALRPTVTVGSDAAATTVEIGAANVTLDNLLFVVGVDSLVVLLDINADDATVHDCEFRGSTSAQALTYIDINGGANGADRTVVEGCKITSTTAGATNGIEIGEVEDGVELIGNFIYGDWTNAGIHNPTGKTATNLLIQDNIVSNAQTGDHAIEIVSACTGYAVDNRMYGDTLGTILDPGSLFCLGNLETDAIDQAGVGSPRTSAGGFPADSITATSIADGAIDAATFAANAIAAAGIAADAITNAKIADAALAYEQYDLDAPVTKTVSKAGLALTAGSVVDVFTVAGGPIQLVALVAQVTTACSANASTLQWSLDPTVGASNTALCAAVEMNAAAIGDIIYITGASGGAAVKAANGTAVPLGCTTPPILTVGGVDLVMSTSDLTTGIVTVHLVYRPLAAGVTVAAA